MSFFFNDTATTEIYTLSLHDALPISTRRPRRRHRRRAGGHPNAAAFFDSLAQFYRKAYLRWIDATKRRPRSEEHTSELQSRQYLVCRLLLEKKKKYTTRSLLFETPYD